MYMVHNNCMKLNTASGQVSVFCVFTENDKLREDLEKVEQLEDKINTELVMLREKISNMETELVTFRDIDSLKKKSEQKKHVRTLILAFTMDTLSYKTQLIERSIRIFLVLKF